MRALFSCSLSENRRCSSEWLAYRTSSFDAHHTQGRKKKMAQTWRSRSFFFFFFLSNYYLRHDSTKRCGRSGAWMLLCVLLLEQGVGAHSTGQA